MKAKELTTQHRIMILEDVLKKLERGDTCGGLCAKINDSAYKLFQILDDANKIIPTFTLKNARKVTDGTFNKKFWWNYDCENYDFKNRIRFVKWMINEEFKNNI